MAMEIGAKRKWEAADGVTRAERIKRVAQQTDGIVALPPCKPSTGTFMPDVEDVVAVVAANTFPNMSTQAFYQNGSDGFDAPILNRIGFIPFNEGWASEPGVGILEGML
ncbi:hypothetical protein FKW77_001900 [Venturia effusa]|uniref:Uncharacterized protein n=1 Tax=Venturia effusa TaxID=50376 RepID=A0A517LRG7_9PEZI|nr:hypothetical protein FKW77_001900 [Venturia effusa]